jgi:hypothetical protein
MAGWAGVALVLAANAWYLRFAALQGFNYFDYGSFLDASWRVFRGQRPYIDFIYTTGPVHLYMNAFFFLLFGFGKSAILTHLITMSSAVIVLCYLTFRKLLPLWITLLLTLFAATGFYWSYPHPWYDQSAYFWGILALWFLMPRLPLKGARTAYAAGALSGGCSVLSLLTKTNIGGAFGLAFFVYLLFESERWRALLGFAVGALAAAAVMAVLIGAPAKYVEQALLSYGPTGTTQLVRFMFLPVWFKNLYWLPAIVIPLALGSERRLFRPHLALFYGIAGVGLFALNTGSLRGKDNLPLVPYFLGLGFIMLVESWKAAPSRGRKILLGIALAVMTATTVVQTHRSADISIRRARGELGVTALNQGDYELQTPELRGWRVSRETGEILDQIVKFVREEVPPNESFLILSDLQIIYPLAGRDSYRGIPFIWHAGIMPTPGAQAEEVRKRIVDHPPDWILTSRQAGPFPFHEIIPYLGLTGDFWSPYVLVKTWGIYGMFKRMG